MQILNENLLNEIFDSEPAEFNKNKVGSNIIYDFTVEDTKNGKPFDYRVNLRVPSKKRLGVDTPNANEIRVIVFGEKKSGSTKYMPLKSVVSPFKTIVTLGAIINDFLMSPVGKKVNGYIIKFQPKIYKRLIRILPKTFNKLIKRVKYIPVDISLDEKSKFMFFVRKGKNPSDVFAFPGFEGQFDGHGGDVDETGESEKEQEVSLQEMSDFVIAELPEFVDDGNGNTWELSVDPTSGAGKVIYFSDMENPGQVMYTASANIETIYNAFKGSNKNVMFTIEADFNSSYSEPFNIDITNLKGAFGVLFDILPKTPVEEPKDSISDKLEILRWYMPKSQFYTVSDQLKGEEKSFYKEAVDKYADRIKNMPKPYGQDGKGYEALVYLHFFNSGSDWYITERDNDILDPQQTFGYTVLNGDTQNAEMGYISIKELIAAGVEFDLYWDIKTLGDVKGVSTDETEETELFSVEYTFSNSIDAHDFYTDIDDHFNNGEFGDYTRNNLVITINDITKDEKDLFDEWYSEYDTPEEVETGEVQEPGEYPIDIGKFNLWYYDEFEASWEYKFNDGDTAYAEIQDVEEFFAGETIELKCYVTQNFGLEQSDKLQNTYDISSIDELKDRILEYQELVDKEYKSLDDLSKADSFNKWPDKWVGKYEWTKKYNKGDTGLFYEANINGSEAKVMFLSEPDVVYSVMYKYEYIQNNIEYTLTSVFPINIMLSAEENIKKVADKEGKVNKHGVNFDDLKKGVFVKIVSDVEGLSGGFEADLGVHNNIGVIDDISGDVNIYIYVAYGGGEHSDYTNSVYFDDIEAIVDEPKKVDLLPELKVGDYVSLTGSFIYTKTKSFIDGVELYDNVARINNISEAGSVEFGVPYEKDVSAYGNKTDIVAIVVKPDKKLKSVPVGEINSHGFNKADIKSGVYVQLDEISKNFETFDKDLSEQFDAYGYIVKIIQDYSEYKNLYDFIFPYSENYIDGDVSWQDIIAIVPEPEKVEAGTGVVVDEEYIFEDEREFYATDKGFEFLKAHNFIATVTMILDDDTVIVKTKDGKQSAVAKSAIKGEAKSMMVDTEEATVEETESGEVVFKQGDKAVSFTQEESIELKKWLAQQN